MKYLIILAVIVLLVVAGVFYFGSGDLSIAPKKVETVQEAPKQDFHAVTTLLQQDMNNIPALLDAPRMAPANAFSVKSRLGNAPAREEYQVLAQACNLIIYADQEHSVRQRGDQEAQHNVSGDPMAGAKANGALSVARAALHARAQADWTAYRQQTDTEVHRLLDSLKDARM